MIVPSRDQVLQVVPKSRGLPADDLQGHADERDTEGEPEVGRHQPSQVSGGPHQKIHNVISTDLDRCG